MGAISGNSSNHSTSISNSSYDVISNSSYRHIAGRPCISLVRSIFRKDRYFQLLSLTRLQFNKSRRHLDSGNRSGNLHCHAGLMGAISGNSSNHSTSISNSSYDVISNSSYRLITGRPCIGLVRSIFRKDRYFQLLSITRLQFNKSRRHLDSGNSHCHVLLFTRSEDGRHTDRHHQRECA